MESITWKFVKIPVDNKDIQCVEEKLSISFPRDYTKYVLEYNAGRPFPQVFDFEDHKEAVFNALLSFRDEDKGNILEVLGWINNQRTNQIIPFANDPFGNYMCFDFRTSKDNPSIVFWNHEIDKSDIDKKVVYICDSFTELLLKLYEPEE